VKGSRNVETTQGTPGVALGGDGVKHRKGTIVNLDEVYQHEADVAIAHQKHGAFGSYWDQCQESGIGMLAKQLAHEACSRSVHLAQEWDEFVATMGVLRTAGAPNDLVVKMERSALAIAADSIDIAAVVGTATAEMDGLEYLYQRAISGTDCMDDVKFPRGRKEKRTTATS